MARHENGGNRSTENLHVVKSKLLFDDGIIFGTAKATLSVRQMEKEAESDFSFETL